MATKIALMGAGGKMGCRILDNLKKDSSFEVYCLEVGEEGIRNLAERGVSPVNESEALGLAEAVVLALPDRLIGKVSQTMIPQLKSGALVISLDPAAAYAGVITLREDIAYFVCHPCHPPLFEIAETKDEQLDWFGGVAAKQSVVCALYQGEEDDYRRGEAIAAVMFQPILRMHRITVEQMVILEPAIVETTTASLLYACKEAMDLGIKMGIPSEAARDFVLGHLRVELAIVFGEAGFPFSDGAMQAIQAAQSKLLKDDWKEQITDFENIWRSVKSITES
jgi:hypothetical protein